MLPKNVDVQCWNCDAQFVTAAGNEEAVCPRCQTTVVRDPAQDFYDDEDAASSE